jgi:DNA-binding MarR family transcriptional regulator
MRPFDEREQGHIAFLYELYTRSAGDARQGVPYEELIDALGLSERVTKRLERDLQAEGLVELTTVPPVTYVGRPAMSCEHRHRRQQTISLTPQGVRLLEDIIGTLHGTSPLGVP